MAGPAAFSAERRAFKGWNGPEHDCPRCGCPTMYVERICQNYGCEGDYRPRPPAPAQPGRAAVPKAVQMKLL